MIFLRRRILRFPSEEILTRSSSHPAVSAFWTSNRVMAFRPHSRGSTMVSNSHSSPGRSALQRVRPDGIAEAVDEGFICSSH